MLNLHCIQPLRHLLAAFAVESVPATTPTATAAADPAIEADTEDPPAGCGWFDSSHELRHGCSVREHASADTLGEELPLANWLQLHLAGWHASVPLDA